VTLYQPSGIPGLPPKLRVYCPVSVTVATAIDLAVLPFEESG